MGQLYFPSKHDISYSNMLRLLSMCISGEVSVVSRILIIHWKRKLITPYRACLHGVGGPQVGEVTPPFHIISYFIYLSRWHDRWVTLLGGLPGLPGMATLSAGVTICHVNVSRWGNRLSRGRVHGKKLKRETCMFWNFVHFLTVSWQKSPEAAMDRQLRSVKCSHFGNLAL